MIIYLLVIFELTVLYLLSHLFGRALATLVARFSTSRRLLITLYALLFLPGTIVHELSHFLMATILGVPVGTINVIPELAGEEVTFGSVSVGEAGFLRRTVVGLAPLFIGTVLIVAGLSFLASTNFSAPLWQTAVIFVLIFQISNTMFSCRADLAALPEVLVLLAVLVAVVAGIVYLFHVDAVQFLVGTLTTSEALTKTRSVAVFLAVPIVIDLSILGLTNTLSGLGKW